MTCKWPSFLIFYNKKKPQFFKSNNHFFVCVVGNFGGFPVSSRSTLERQSIATYMRESVPFRHRIRNPSVTPSTPNRTLRGEILRKIWRWRRFGAAQIIFEKIFSKIPEKALRIHLQWIVKYYSWPACPMQTSNDFYERFRNFEATKKHIFQILYTAFQFFSFPMMKKNPTENRSNFIVLKKTEG